MKQKSISSLKKEADRVFSLWIRKRDKRCVLCGNTENLQCGHYISRGKNNTRYDPVNCHCCCVGCNVFKNGNYPVFTLYLMRKYGNGIIKELERKGRIEKRFTPKELETIIQTYDKNKKTS